MDEELAERKQAMLMYHVQHLGKTAICRKLKRTRPWLDRWLARYDPGDAQGSLQDQLSGPPHGQSKWSKAIQEQVLQMRQERSQDPQWRYAYKGAEAIHWELKALGSPEVPPIRTLHSWFVKAGLVPHPTKRAEPKPKKAIPLPTASAVNRVQQMDLKGPIYLSGNSSKYYLVSVRDGYSQRCAIDVLTQRDADQIVAFLVSAWTWLGRPDYLQLDNALEFRGSNRYPRSFGRVVRCAIDVGVEVVFNPPREPWWNGGIEWFNSFLSERLLTVHFADLASLQAETKVCQHRCNQTHRLAQFAGATPDEVAAQAPLRLLSGDYQRHLLKSLPQDHGFVSFVRRVRKSGRITLGAGDRFMVDPQLAQEYVLARADLHKTEVVISYQGRTLCTYDFSPATVGQWAADEKPPAEAASVQNEVIKVQSTM